MRRQHGIADTHQRTEICGGFAGTEEHLRSEAVYTRVKARIPDFICSDCGLISDFTSDTLNAFTPPPEVSAIETVSLVHIELRGICECCAHRGNERRSGHQKHITQGGGDRWRHWTT